MKKLLFALIMFLFSSNLMSQLYGFELEEKYDSIPAKEWNRQFIAVLDAKFDSLVKEGVDSIMVYYCASRFANSALLVFKTSSQNCTIAIYQYSPGFSRLGWEILSPSIIDSINILDFYFIFKNNENRTLPFLLYSTDGPPTFGKFYIGKSTEVYGAFFPILDQKFVQEESKEMDRIIRREQEIYFNKNK